MLLNLWDSDVLIRDFMKLYSLTEIQMCNILKRLHFDTEQDNITIFCEETGNKLDEIDVAHGIEFLGKIVSTTVDDFKSLRQIGLATLDVLLENDTPISQHLKKYQIEIKPSTQELFLKENGFIFLIMVKTVNGVRMETNNANIAVCSIKICIAHIWRRFHH